MLSVICGDGPLSCFGSVLTEVNTPFLVHSSTLLSQHRPTSQQLVRNQTTLEQHGYFLQQRVRKHEASAPPRRSDTNQQEKTTELSFLRYLKHD